MVDVVLGEYGNTMVPRLTGVITGMFTSDDPRFDKMLGSSGTILSESGRMFVWAASHFYRNGSHPVMGATCTFEVLAGTYATNISTVRK